MEKEQTNITQNFTSQTYNSLNIEHFLSAFDGCYTLVALSPPPHPTPPPTPAPPSKLVENLEFCLKRKSERRVHKSFTFGFPFFKNRELQK